MAARKAKITRKWRNLFKLIPGGYDPLLTAGDCWFDEKEAERRVKFFPVVLRHISATPSVPAGAPFELPPWEQAVVGCIFGWKRPDGTRRYRDVFFYLPKKTGKTTLGAGLLLCAWLLDHEFGAEIYSAAATRDQAGKVFKHVAGMVKLQPELSSRLRVYGDKGGTSVRSIVNDAEFSSYKPLSADADVEDGFKPHITISDEIHRHKKRDLHELLRRSTGASVSPLIISLTTADFHRPSLCNEMVVYARSVRDNPGDPNKPGYDQAHLPVLCEASKDDDWTDPKVWRRVNPNLGITVTEEFLHRECMLAKQSPTKRNDFLRFYLNIITDSAVAFFDMDAWRACSGDVGDLEGQICWAGLDMGSTTDTTALVLMFPGDPMRILPFFWIPGETARKRSEEDKVPYLSWITDGFMWATEGERCDYDQVRRDICDLGEIYNIQEINIDPWNSTQLQWQLQQEGFDVIKYRQGMASLNAPLKELERLIIARRLLHSGHPILEWMAGNTVVITDTNANVRPNKKKSTGRIDGIVATVMALGGWMRDPEEVDVTVIRLGDDDEDDDS